jgi:hypothetical protein
MMGRYDVPTFQVVAYVTFCFGRVAEKDAWCTTGSELVGRRGHGVGIAEGAKNSQVIIGWGVAEKRLVGRYVVTHVARRQLSSYVDVAKASNKNMDGVEA